MQNLDRHSTPATQVVGKRYEYPPTAQDWTSIRGAVRRLYVDDKLPLKDVRSVLRDRHGFKATDRMIKARLKQWGYLKNAKKEDWHFLALLHMRCDEQGQEVTEFDVRGHRKTLKDLQRFIRNQSMTPEQFYNEAREKHGHKAIPEYIRCVNLSPTGEKGTLGVRGWPASPPNELNQMRQTNYQPPYTRAMLDQSHQPRHALGVKRSSSTSSSIDCDYEMGNTTTAIDEHLSAKIMRDSAYESGSAMSNLCPQMQHDIEAYSQQIIHPTSLKSKLGTPDLLSWSMIHASDSDSRSDTDTICTRCKQSSRAHFISLDSLEPSRQISRNILHGPSGQHLHLPVTTKEEGAHLWIARCFLAAVLVGRGNNEGAERALTSAASEWERHLLDKDALLLIAANNMVTMLMLHNQGQLAKKIILAAKAIADNHYPAESPINVTLEFLAAQATKSLNESRISSEHLRQVYENFLAVLPPKHPYLIAARFNLSWMLKNEGKVEQAESHAVHVHQISHEVLGETHLQTIFTQSVLANCAAQGGEKRRQECIRRFRGVVDAATQTLGSSHPYTTEAKRFLGWNLYKAAGEAYTPETLEIYKQILDSQIHFMGRQHTYTNRAREDYEDALKEMKLWSDADGNPSIQQKELSELLCPAKTYVMVDHARRPTKTSSRTESFAHPDMMPDVDIIGNEEYDEDVEQAVDDMSLSDVASPSSVEDFAGY